MWSPVWVCKDIFWCVRGIMWYFWHVLFWYTYMFRIFSVLVILWYVWVCSHANGYVTVNSLMFWLVIVCFATNGSKKNLTLSSLPPPRCLQWQLPKFLARRLPWSLAHCKKSESRRGRNYRRHLSHSLYVPIGRIPGLATDWLGSMDVLTEFRFFLDPIQSCQGTLRKMHL